ncbi:hypothetical protein ACIBQX_46155 [Nonomuraea sp. NPDC049714]|uniref:hypothetical protein n=1 Tax=Nonomuraea sp. NPDC049714 TaxID=3364357 RepID=UPI0037BCA0B4
MHTLTSKRVTKFARDFGFEGSDSDLFERYVAANYLFQYLRDDVESIERSISVAAKTKASISVQ